MSQKNKIILFLKNFIYDGICGDYICCLSRICFLNYYGGSRHPNCCCGGNHCFHDDSEKTNCDDAYGGDCDYLMMASSAFCYLQDTWNSNTTKSGCTCPPIADFGLLPS